MVVKNYISIITFSTRLKLDPIELIQILVQFRLRVRFGSETVLDSLRAWFDSHFFFVSLSKILFERFYQNSSLNIKKKHVWIKLSAKNLNPVSYFLFEIFFLNFSGIIESPCNCKWPGFLYDVFVCYGIFPEIFNSLEYCLDYIDFNLWI